MSGAREVVLRSDVLEVVLLPELGARIHRIRAFGEDLLRTPADRAAHRDEPFFWGAYHMAPWCNRAAAGPSTIAGRTVRLDANFADGSAIHGLVSSSPWEERDDGSLAIRIGGHEGGWPWQHEVSLAPAVDAETLTLDYRVRNLSDAPMPAGIGFHPWFRRPVELRLPAAFGLCEQRRIFGRAAAGRWSARPPPSNDARPRHRRDVDRSQPRASRPVVAGGRAEREQSRSSRTRKRRAWRSRPRIPSMPSPSSRRPTVRIRCAAWHTASRTRLACSRPATTFGSESGSAVTQGAV